MPGTTNSPGRSAGLEERQQRPAPARCTSGRARTRHTPGIQVATARGFSNKTLAFAIQQIKEREGEIPEAWYPRLQRATPAQRKNWRLIGEGHGIHWPDVDEDISTIMLIEGLPSIEYERAKSG